MRIALWDDVGFGTASTYGAPCATQTEDRLAAAGLRFVRFHTTAPCSPTGAAVLSGRNHRTAGMSGITRRLFRGTTALNEHSGIDTQNLSRNITDAVAIRQSDSRNIIRVQGGGWAPSVEGGIRLGQGASVTVLVDDSLVAAGHVDRTQSLIFSGDETADIGIGHGLHVSDRYSDSDSSFSGEIERVQIEPEYDSRANFITPWTG